MESLLMYKSEEAMKQTEKAHELMSCPTFDESDAGKKSPQFLST